MRVSRKDYPIQDDSAERISRTEFDTSSSETLEVFYSLNFGNSKFGRVTKPISFRASVLTRFLVEHKRLVFMASLLLSLIVRSPIPDDEIRRIKLEKFVSTGDFVFEIGSNKGGLTLILSRLVGASGRVVSFEPNLVSYSLLRAYTRNLRNISCYNLGFGPTEGTGSLYLQGPTDKAARAEPVSGKGRIHVEFTMTTIDLFIQKSAIIPSIIMIDAEGAEAEVLIGAEITLSTIQPTVVLQLHGISDDRFAKVMRLLSSKGFDSQVLYSDGVMNCILLFSRR